MEDPFKVFLREKNKDMKTIIDLEKKIVKMDNKIKRMRSNCKKQVNKESEEYEGKLERVRQAYAEKVEDCENRINSLEKDLIRVDDENKMLLKDRDTLIRLIEQGVDHKDILRMWKDE